MKNEELPMLTLFHLLMVSYANGFLFDNGSI